MSGGRNPLSYTNDRETASSFYSDSNDSSGWSALYANQATYGNQRRTYFTGVPPRALSIRREDVLETPGVGSEGQKLYFGSVHVDIGPDIREVRPCALECLSMSSGLFSHNCIRAPRHAPFTLLPFNPATMELVGGAYGRMPFNRRAVIGGFDSHGNTLYHGISFSATGISGAPNPIVGIPGEVRARGPGVKAGFL
ncbi:hypothetical protein SCHPADRAFT_994727 [Schizopora paradoxa]|uniref:Uncharacterized protein n=1 Tax=Schizopora paradoxa TaxID=27342 RepID=A0A0H2RXV4_9AGAM|nr:hypothetical protein SCHPADRAFT_994727 [Schizopora paradoxa]